MSRPVQVRSTGGEPLIVSQRALFGASFEEVTGTPTSALAASGSFTWYDQRTPGMSTWVLMSNRGAIDTTVSVYMGGILRGIYNVPAGGVVKYATFPGTMDGPVQVISSNQQPLMVSERTLYYSSFNEMVGIAP
jgi:hypothetical protein